MKEYKTSELAKIVGVHPNTVRIYEEWGLLPRPVRRKNGYRLFTDLHADQLKLVRTALQIVVLQNGLRKKMIAAIKLSALGKYDEALALTNEYRLSIDMEIRNAHEAVAITQGLLRGVTCESGAPLRRKDAAECLGITMDALRNWEMNGLLTIKRTENGYRVYTDEDMRRIKIIRSLKCANYSLTAILRMMNALSTNESVCISQVLNTPLADEEIVSACDQLLISLMKAKANAEQMAAALTEMKIKYANPPL